MNSNDVSLVYPFPRHEYEHADVAIIKTMNMDSQECFICFGKECTVREAPNSVEIAIGFRSEKDIDSMIDVLLELRKQYTDVKTKLNEQL